MNVKTSWPHIVNTRRHFKCRSQTCEAAAYQGVEEEHRQCTSRTAVFRTWRLCLCCHFEC